MYVFLSQSERKNLGAKNLVIDQLVDEHEYLKQGDQFILLRNDLIIFPISLTLLIRGIRNAKYLTALLSSLLQNHLFVNAGNLERSFRRSEYRIK